MKILVTGATGFIGINLSKALMRLGHSVVGVDNFFSSNRDALQKFTQHSSYSFFEHDIMHPLPQEVSQDVDLICNLACPASPRQYFRDPIYTVKTSVLGIMNLLDLATLRNIPLLQASTSEVYGDPLQHPQHESYWGNVNPIGVRACYDEGKRLAESLAFDYKRAKNTKIKIIRIFNTYGPYMAYNDGRVVSNFIVQALNGRDLTVYGDGSQTRTLCYIDDLVDAITKYLLLDDPQNEVTGPINLGGEVEITIKQLAQTVIAHVVTKNVTSNIAYHPLPSDDPVRRKPDCSYAKEILEWYAKTPFEIGLQKTIEWMHNQIDRQT